MIEAIIAAVSAVLVAVISAGAAIYTKVRTLDNNNTEQHAQNLARLERIERAIDNVADDVVEVKDRQMEHLQWHLDQEADKVVDLPVRRQA